jgi:hypothetical protein
VRSLLTGGAGKTTMARLLFNCLAPGFQHTAIIKLQLDEGDQLAAKHLADALTRLHVDFNAGSTAELLLPKLQNFVKNNKVLLVLDNVSHYSQLEAMLPDTFTPGSKVIITSRHNTLDEVEETQQVGCIGAVLQLPWVSSG